MKKTALLSKIRTQFNFLKGNLLVLVISFMFFRSSIGLTSSFYPLYLRGLGASPFVIGMIGSIGSFFMGVIRIPGGFIADFYGRKKIIVTFTFFVGLSFLFYALAPDWRFIVIGSIINNLSFIYLPALEALEADSIPENIRGVGYAASQKLPQITNVFAPLVTITLIDSLGLIKGVRIAYLLAALFAIIAGSIRHLYLVETLEKIPH